MAHYPKGTTLYETYLCRKCSFTDDDFTCIRAQKIKNGCLIIRYRNGT